MDGEGRKGGGGEKDDVRRELEEEGYAFETSGFQKLQRRLEPLEVRAAKLRAKKEAQEAGDVFVPFSK